mmetsp:Transcript_1409/g.1817  ORF Transcript_1409/g.1817 Transcript_1409/m.1817 type:complete len:442 (-) Transcript_1409:64-1389(-)
MNKPFVACVVTLASMVDADMMGYGLAKTTYTGSQSLVALAFNENYLPVYNSDDSCPDNTCNCTIDDVVYVVEQGRCQLNFDSGTSISGTPMEGFGLHIVNCSTNGQPGGMTTAQVEAEFATKFGDMSSYDSFMDYNVALLTSDLDSYVTAFDVDNVTYLPIAFTDQDEAYCGVLVLVPESQMVIEVVQLNSSTTTKIASHPRLLKMNEQRHPHKSLQRASSSIASQLAARKGAVVDEIMVPVTIGRAASNLDAISTFYLDGMQTTLTLSYDSDAVSKRCFLWEKQNATSDVCFTKRSDDATSTDFKVVDFENMLNTVHANVIAGKATAIYGCNNKWMDNHYAIDTTGFLDDGNYIVDYIDSTEGLYAYCDVSGDLHYLSDPTGWGIQMDLGFTKKPLACPASDYDDDPPDPPAPGDDDGPPQPPDVCVCTGMFSCGATGGN